MPDARPMAWILFSTVTMPERGSWNPVLSYWMSKKRDPAVLRQLMRADRQRVGAGATRPWTGCRATAATPSPPRASAGWRPCAPGVSSRWPGGAASTTRSAAPFWTGNLALIRSVARCTSDAGEVEVVDQRAVEGDVQADQHHEDADPGEDHAPRVAGEVPGHPGLRARVRDPALVIQFRVCEISHERSTSLYVDCSAGLGTPAGPEAATAQGHAVFAGYRGSPEIVPAR